MARQSTGSIVEKTTTRGTSYGIRYRAGGKRRFEHVGYAADGVTRRDAEQALADALGAVRRGEWTPLPEAVAVRECPTFSTFATEWFVAKLTEGGKRGEGLSPAGEADLRWQIDHHLFPTFAHMRLDTITVEDVDSYRRSKVREGRIHTTSINKTLSTLSAILEAAQEYGYVERNVAAGKRRRLSAAKPRRTFLNRADHMAALLDAAGRLDVERDYRTPPYRRVLVAVLMLAGLRIEEALSLRWRHVDLAGGRLKVPGTKTEAAARVVPLLPLLRDELLAHAARRGSRDPNALVFSTRTGAKPQATHVRRRILAPAVEKANAALADRDIEPLPEGLTPHSMRRTCATILVALGWDPARVMRALGHTDAAFTLSVYAAAVDWREGEADRIRALVDGATEWASTGTKTAEAGIQNVEREAA